MDSQIQRRVVARLCNKLSHVEVARLNVALLLRLLSLSSQQICLGGQLINTLMSYGK